MHIEWNTYLLNVVCILYENSCYYFRKMLTFSQQIFNLVYFKIIKVCVHLNKKKPYNHQVRVK